MVPVYQLYQKDQDQIRDATYISDVVFFLKFYLKLFAKNANYPKRIIYQQNGCDSKPCANLLDKINPNRLELEWRL